MAFTAWIVENQRDLAIAFLFAIIGAVVWDVVKTGSVAGVRQLKNKLSEQSVARLRERIAQLERNRDEVSSYLSSDRALYLATLRLMFGILLFACVGASTFIIDSLLPLPGFRFSVVAVFIFVMAITLAVYGLQLAGLNTRSKISEKVATLDSEINDLKTKLDLRQRKIAD